jgi:hypothetical protein
MTDSLSMHRLVRFDMRPNMGFLVVFVALFQAGCDWVNRNLFCSLIGHDGMREKIIEQEMRSAPFIGKIIISRVTSMSWVWSIPNKFVASI